MNPWVIVIFLLVHLGMVLGEVPGLKLDRTGVALLGLLVGGVPREVLALSAAAAWLWVRS